MDSTIDSSEVCFDESNLAGGIKECLYLPCGKSSLHKN